MVDQAQTFRKTGWHLGILAGASLLLGLLFQLLLPVGRFWSGFLAASALIFVSTGLLYFIWRKAGGVKSMMVMMLAAFLLRLALGVFLAWGLPRFGYAEREQEAGFVYADAFRREDQAWALAHSEDSFLRAFSDEFGADQYGGMLIFSALIYRFFSPDAYRPALISIVMAALFTGSIPFLAAVLKRRFDNRTALLGGWILALYPEGVLLGAAQMREPFLILFFAMVFWAADRWLARIQPKRAWLTFFFSAVGLILFSYRVALPILFVLLVWVWIEESADASRRWLRIAGWAAIALGLAAGLIFFREWVRDVVHWDTLQTYLQSGRVQYELENTPDWLQLPFILIYGLFQPVLPAAIAAPAPWIWRALGIFRALGWYALLPFLLYALVGIWRVRDPDRKRLLVWMSAVVWFWIVFVSARAGGDQWDNPRYRTIFLPWMAGIAAWAVSFARAHRDRWLPRWLVVEGIFLGFFTEWYISRYYAVIRRLSFWVMIALIVGLSLTVLVGGWLWDRKHPPRPLTGHEDSL